MSQLTDPNPPHHTADRLDPASLAPTPNAPAADDAILTTGTEPQATPPPIDHHGEAFSRNVGWLTQAEQFELRGRTVAIAGMGGVGGVHLLTLARLGIGGFHIADMDVFERANFNRQAGATESTIGRAKVEVMAEQACDINPHLRLKRFDRGVNEDNLDAFLDGVDLYVDSLDFFCLDIRQKVFAACAARGVPAITAAPLGMGTAFLNFLPGGMSFEEYFGLAGRGDLEQRLRFLVGLSPRFLQQGYLVDPTRVDLAGKRGPSTPIGCQLCAGVAGAQAVKILLGRGDVLAAPRGLHFDAYRNRFVKTWRPGGHRNPVTRLCVAIAKHKYKDLLDAQTSDSTAADAAEPNESTDTTTVDRILDLARWAPSGDNTQPWRFEIHDDQRLTVHATTRIDTGVYDQRHHCLHLMMGVLEETLRIAASAYGRRCRMTRREQDDAGLPVFDLELPPDPDVREDPLLPYLLSRTTQRKAYRTRPLGEAALAELNASVGDGFEVRWFRSWSDRLGMARINFGFAKVRMTQKACHDVHCRVIDWGKRESRDRLPGQGLGMDPLMQRLTRWLVRDWRRVDFMNRFLAGSLLPRVQLELIPGVRCGGHFALVADTPPGSIEDRMRAGRAFQRFWLTAARLGLQFQPGFTPILFGGYVRDGYPFLEDAKGIEQARQMTQRFDQLMGGDDVGPRVVALGRVGYGRKPVSRSTRLSVDELKA